MRHKVRLKLMRIFCRYLDIKYWENSHFDYLTVLGSYDDSSSWSHKRLYWLSRPSIQKLLRYFSPTIADWQPQPQSHSLTENNNVYTKICLMLWCHKIMWATSFKKEIHLSAVLCSSKQIWNNMVISDFCLQTLNRTAESVQSNMCGKPACSSFPEPGWTTIES